MGGLVARSAVAHATNAGTRGPDMDRHGHAGLTASGRPARARCQPAGAPAARGRGDTRWLAGLLAARSVGIKDLRFGNVVDADWDGHDPDDRTGHCIDVPLHVGP